MCRQGLWAESHQDHIIIIISIMGARGSVVGWGTMQQVGR
jgi:hypothetical protein